MKGLEEKGEKAKKGEGREACNNLKQGEDKEKEKMIEF